MYFESLQKESTEEIIKETIGENFQELKEDRRLQSAETKAQHAQNTEKRKMKYKTIDIKSAVNVSLLRLDTKIEMKYYLNIMQYFKTISLLMDKSTFQQ